ncbi:hypothetical protein Goklo_024947, partial [Gossypium klotzschianum]|nr:hypothetical protein [Gossypium klotzschianum]
MGCGFCEAALSNTVGTLIVDCVVKPVGRQLDYVRCFHDNDEKLREKKLELADARDRLQHEIEDAERRLLLIQKDVQNLKSKADKTLSEEIQLNKRCLNWCPNWIWRYQLSKKAMKRTQNIFELLERFGRLGPVGYRDPTALPTIDFLCSKEFVVSESSKGAFNQIIEALKDENINMIGLCGMGGVGKTTLAREVGSQAQKLNLVDKKLNSFDKVLITTVSQKPNFERIQDQIAQYIGFDMKNEKGRRSEQELWLRLKKEQRILIILDDIWEPINLKEKIGIPIGDDHKGCKAALSNTVGTLVVDCVVKPVGRQLDYVRRFHDNVEKLRERNRELADARDRLLHKIEDAKNRLLLIENDVQNLQSRAAETLSDMGTLEEEIQLNKRCLNWCPNWSWRYQLSKKAMKKIQDISELLDKFGQLGPLGYRAPTALPTIDFLCSKEFVFSKSSETAFYQIIEALKDENINMIGLWGMGGVGKTTLAHEIGSQAQKLNLFDKVVITVVSQKPNFEKIQDQIAQYIGFDMKNEQGRRSEQELWLRLKNEPRILVIVDDIWESINLKEKIGIPIGDDHKGCKVLLTTRRQPVCRAMDCQNVVQLGCLNDDEAWTLFEKKAGLDDFSDDSIKSLANQIVKKCGGLPIAIVPLGSALKGKTHHEWQTAYRRLKDRRLTEIEDVNEENAYVCLEASFDYLKNMETKTCFLLCSLFPEDDEIYVENLVGYAWGLALYKGMDSIKDVRSEVLASIETLKNSGLLLDCGERHVKMHDVVRQFALWIASSRKEISFGTVETLPMDESFKHYTAISFETDQTDELPKG